MFAQPIAGVPLRGTAIRPRRGSALMPLLREYARAMALGEAGRTQQDGAHHPS